MLHLISVVSRSVRDPGQTKEKSILAVEANKEIFRKPNPSPKPRGNGNYKYTRSLFMLRLKYRKHVDFFPHLISLETRNSRIKKISSRERITVVPWRDSFVESSSCSVRRRKKFCSVGKIYFVCVYPKSVELFHSLTSFSRTLVERNAQRMHSNDMWSELARKSNKRYFMLL